MVPKDLLFLSELPITQNGKIDRKNLPEPRKKKDSSKAPAASATQHEATVKTIWRELLDTEEVKPENNFFESGGNSLLAIRLVAHLDSRLNVKIELSDLLRHSTFANLMELIAEKNTVVKQERPSIVCIKNEGGELPPLFLVHPIGGSVFCYNQLAKELDEDQPVYGFYAKGTEEGFPALNDVKAMAAKYIHGMKTVQKNGPYKLGGWSFGGIVAFEMAIQLAAQGETVSDLFLIDSYFHSKGYAFKDAPETKIFAAFLKDVSYQKGKAAIPEGSMQEMLAQAIRQNLFPPELSVDAVRKLLEIFKNNCIAYAGYRPEQTVDCNAHLIFAEDMSYIGSAAETEKWKHYLHGDTHHYRIEGNHFTIFNNKELPGIMGLLKEANTIYS
jgi:thioesterase domain-containing protein/acyl carrier protein